MKYILLLILIFAVAISSFVSGQTAGFTENRGQINDQNDRPNPDVLYLLNRPGINVQLKKNSFSYDTWTVEWKKREANEQDLIKYRNHPGELDAILSYPVFHFHRVDIELSGSQASPRVIAENPSAEVLNYYLNDRAVCGVRHYSKVTYKDIYPYIDLEFFIRTNAKAGESDFEYQFVVRPGGNPDDIRLKYNGSNGARLKDGKVVVSVSHGDFSEKIPASFTAENKIPVQVGYKSSARDVFGFTTGKYDKSLTLIIDPWPQLLWATYYGGTFGDEIKGNVTDNLDNVYIAGQSASTSNIATAGAHQVSKAGGYDGFVAKLDLSGQRIWGTYYGGNGQDYINDIAIDNTGNLYIAGSTSSTGGIATAGAHQAVLNTGTSNEDGFLVKFDNNGIREWGTYYGGTIIDRFFGVAVSAAGNIYASGETNSPLNIATMGTHQPGMASANTETFLVKFSNSGVREWGTYFGGSDFEFIREGIRLDAMENVFLTGRTNSASGIATAGTHQQTFGGNYDAYFAKFNTNGILEWATYFGGTEYEEGFDIVLNPAGEIFAVGWTYSNTGIATAGAYNDTYGGLCDGYIAKFSTSGQLLTGTYLSGSNDDYLGSIDITPAGDLIISGITRGTTGLATEYVHQDTFMGNQEMILFRFNQSLQRIWCTYFGGTLDDNSWDVCVTPLDYIYVCGSTKSLTNISTPGANQESYGGGTSWDGYLARFVDCSMTTTDSHIMPLCYGDTNGTATITPQFGTPMYFYLWDNGQSAQTATNLPAGTYYVTIADTRGCLWNDTVDVLQPNPLITQAIGSDALCYGSSNGVITAIPIGGTPAYSYVWDNGCTDSSCTAVAAGTYIVTVYDANNCTTTETVTIGEPLQIQISFAVTDALCYNGSDGIAIATVTGGTPGPGYSFLWSNSTTSDTVNGLAAGEHYLTVTDANNCEMTDTVTIGQPDSLILSFNEIQPSCFGYNDGLLEVVATGGTAPFAYLWDNSDTTATADSLAAGTYQVTITDFNNCSVTGTGDVTDPPLLTSVFDSTLNVSCHGFADGYVSSLASGGNPNYAYNWSNGSDSSSAGALIAGMYYLTLTDAHNCLFVDSVEISQPDTIAVSFVNTTSLCFGDSSGVSQAIVTGGTAPYTLLWSNGVTTGTNAGIPAGSYTLTVTDHHSCIFEAVTQVIQPDSIQIIFVADSAACNGDTNGAASAVILGGINPFSYLWSTGSVNDTITQLTAGNYGLTVTDANGCVQNDQVTISQPPPIRLFVNYYHLTCFESNDGSAEASAMGGVPPYQFLWSNGHVGTSVTGLAAGTYGVTVFDSHGCTESLDFIINQPNLLVSNGQSIDVVCYGDASGAAWVTTSGGTQPYSYAWDNGFNQQVDSSITAGTYIITTTDSHGCTDIDTITVVQPDDLIIAMQYQNVLCYNHANGWAIPAVTGGILPYEYLWNTGDTTAAISDLTPGNYQLVVTDSNLCVTSYSITVTQPDSLYFDYSVQHNTCNQFNNGAVIGSIVGGTIPYQFSFENSSQQPMPFTGLPADTYYYELTDSNGCFFGDTIIITQPDTLLPTAVYGIDPSDNYGFANVSVTGGTLPYSYHWSNNTFAEDLTHLIGGSYTLTVTDDNGCISTLSVFIDLTLTIPTVITPNNDGYNDDFEILNLEAFNNIKLYIYNRWDILLFSFEGTGQEYNSGKRFDGTHNGKPLPMGSYAFIVILNDEQHFTGALMIKY
jgi:gliding motility-associated-like protein